MIENEPHSYSKNLVPIFSKNEKPSFLEKFSKFFSIPLVLTRIKDAMDRHVADQEYNVRLFKEVNRIIRADDYKYFPRMIEDGYIMTKKQKEIINSYVNKRLDYSGTKELMFVEDFLKLGFTLDNVTKEKYLYNMLINDHVYNIDNLFSLNVISETDKPLIVTNYIRDQEKREILDKQDIKLEAFTASLREYIASSDFYNTQLHSLVKAIKSSKKKKHYLYTDPYKHLMNIFTHENKEVVLKNMPFEKFMNFVDELKVIYPSYDSNLLMVEIKKIIEGYYQNGAEHTTPKPSIIKSIIKNTSTKVDFKETEHIEIEKLPEAAKNIIKEIKELYNNIIKNNVEDFDVDNLFENRMPEVLDKYLKIAEKYRNTLKNNEGKTAEDLLTESLENIRSNFDKKWENINIQALSSLSATNKYTRTFK